MMFGLHVEKKRETSKIADVVDYCFDGFNTNES